MFFSVRCMSDHLFHASIMVTFQDSVEALQMAATLASIRGETDFGRSVYTQLVVSRFFR